MVQSKVLTFGIITAVLAVLITGCGATEITQSQYDSLAMCLRDKGAVLYKTEWCQHCQNQKEAFGTSIQYITQVDCDEQREACAEADVARYPTWKIGNEMMVGTKSPETLAALAGC